MPGPGVHHEALSVTPPIHLDADRLLPANPVAAAVARRLSAAVSELPIISPHVGDGLDVGRGRSHLWPSSLQRVRGAPWWFLDAQKVISPLRAAVTEGRLEEDEAIQTAVDLVATRVGKAFRL